MPRKYTAKKPRGSKFKNTPIELLARQAVDRQAELREVKFRCLTAAIRRELRHTPQNHTIDILCGYMRLEELDMVLTDLRAKKEQADAMAAQNRARQAS